MRLFSRLCQTIAFLLSSLPVQANERVLVAADFNVKVFSEYPTCQQVQTTGLRLSIDSAISAPVSDPDYLKSYVNWAVVSMTYWPEHFACLRKPFKGSGEVFVRNQSVGTFSFAYYGDGRRPTTLSMVNILEQPFDYTGVWKFLSDRQRGRYGRLSDFKLDRALAAFDKISPEGSEQSPQHLYVRGKLLLLSKRKSDRNAGLKLLAQASNAGHASATYTIMAQLAYNNPITSIGNSIRHMKFGEAAQLPPFASRTFAKNHDFFLAAQSQRLGAMVSLEHEMNSVGVFIEGDTLVQRSVAPPTRSSIDTGLYTYLSRGIQSQAILNDAFWQSYSPDMPKELVKIGCSNDWCFAYGKLIKYRMAPFGSPNCPTISEDRASCTFEWRLVFDSNYLSADDPQWLILSALTGPHVRFQGSADFDLSGGKWIMDQSSLALKAN